MGEDKHDGLTVPGRVDLARELPFQIGLLRIEPATRQVANGQRRETLEPRVMQVLIALGRAKGGVVSRDELIDRCWDGRIVGEDAINRAIFRLRQVAANVGGESFSVETITKVGYRLVPNAGPKEPDAFGLQPAPAIKWTRRQWVAGAAAVAGVAGSIGLILQPWRHRPKPEAVELVRLGDLAQRASRPDQTRQAVTYFERAVRIDPDYATAWGMLALSYTHGLDGFSEAQLPSVPPRIRSAANRALRLDPDNTDAQLALACIPPYFRNWSRMERELRRIHDRDPTHWLANGRLAILYYQVGRLADGAALHRGVIAREPMIPGPYAFAATALSNLGQLQEADAILSDAAERWPANPFIWNARYNHLLYSGRAASAAALMMDPEARPSGMSDANAAPFVTLARAVETRSGKDVHAALRFAREIATQDVRGIADAVPILALFGQVDLAFAALERYFLDHGSFGSSSPIGPYTRRYTDFLFSQSMAAVRNDRRYRDLTQAVGLEDYWRGAGMSPPQFPAHA